MTAQEFESAATEYQPAMMARAYRMLNNREDAEQAVQESLLKGWRSLGTFEGRCNAKTWLYRITGTTCIDMIRRKKHRPEEQVEELERISGVLQTNDSLLLDLHVIKSHLSEEDYRFALEYVDVAGTRETRARTGQERCRWNRIRMKMRRVFDSEVRFSKKTAVKTTKRKSFDSESYFWEQLTGLAL